MRKSIFIVLAVVIIIGAALFVWKAKQMNYSVNTQNETSEENEYSSNQTVKEFSMTAYYDPAIKKPVYSLPQMTVKKGDKVRVKVTNTMGMHDFTIDELKVHEELPLNKEVVVEFTADKAGEFIYYCSKPGHRQAGQWGTLKVTE